MVLDIQLGWGVRVVFSIRCLKYGVLDWVSTRKRKVCGNRIPDWAKNGIKNIIKYKIQIWVGAQVLGKCE